MKRALLTLMAMLPLISCSGKDLPNEENSNNSETPNTETSMKIQVTDGSHTVVFELNDTPVAKSLYDQLPITVDVENYSSNEKIFYPPTALSVTGGVEGDCPVGTLAYFSPWKNVVMYYGAASRYSGLYLLGSAIEGKDLIKNLTGRITVSKQQP